LSVMLAGSVGVCSMNDANDSYRVARLVDSVDDDAVCASAGAVSIGEWRSESLPNPVGVVEQWPDDELVRGEGYRLGAPRW